MQVLAQITLRLQKEAIIEEGGVKDKTLKIPESITKPKGKWEEKTSDIEKTKKKNIVKTEDSWLRSIDSKKKTKDGRIFTNP